MKLHDAGNSNVVLRTVNKNNLDVLLIPVNSLANKNGSGRGVRGCLMKLAILK